jgi:hypothetical protein
MGTAVVSFFDQPVNETPQYLQTFDSGISKDLALGGMGRNRIGLKGNRFRLIVNGIEEAILEQNSMELVIVGASPGVGRLFFGADYDADVKSHPLCYSADGITPGQDVINPQSVKCAVCPQNQKGSKITQGGDKTKACSYFKRMAVSWLGDDKHRVFQLDGKALTIFGQGEPAQNKFTLSEYGNKLKTRGLDPAHMVTKVSFDPQSSVPKLYFSPLRMITEEEAGWVQDLVNSEEVKSVVTITAITDASDAESEAPAVQSAPVAKPVVAPKPAAAAPRPVAQPKPAAAPAPAPTVAKATLVKAAAPKPAPAPVVKEVETGNSDLDAFLSQLDGEAAQE